jgi:hypothetical protein
MAKNIPSGCEIFQMTMQYTNIFHSKAHQNIPIIGNFGLKIPTPSGNPAKIGESIRPERPVCSPYHLCT